MTMNFLNAFNENANYGLELWDVGRSGAVGVCRLCGCRGPAFTAQMQQKSG